MHMRCLSDGHSGSPKAVYRAMVEAGQLRSDDRQEAALVHLQRLYDELLEWKPPVQLPPPPPPKAKVWRGPQFDKYGQPTGGGAMYTGVDNQESSPSPSIWSRVSSMFSGSRDGDDRGAAASTEPVLSNLSSVPQGVYMHGGVGCGKSLLMDTFFDCAPLDASRKRRVHFHEFMLEIHKRMHELRQINPEMGDPVPYVAHDISTATNLICFVRMPPHHCSQAELLQTYAPAS